MSKLDPIEEAQFAQDIANIYGKEEIVHYGKLVQQQPNLVEYLINITFAATDRGSVKGSWLLTHVCDRSPELIQPYVERINENITKPLHHSTRRHVLRALTQCEISNCEIGHIVQKSFDWLQSSNELAAVKVHAMEVLLKAAKTYPELLDELADSVKEQMRHGGTAIQSRGKSILKRIQKIQSK